MRKVARPQSLWTLSAVCAAALAGLSACGSSDDRQEPPPPPPAANAKPAYLGAILHKSYDGTSDDLLTAGLGKTGLASAVPPLPADASAPLAAQLRRLAIWTNYRALLDMTEAGGYGRFYGPNVNATGEATTSEGLIAGDEYLAFADDGSGRQNVTLMVQIPASFDPANPCIQSATSSGSRGVYGGMSTGEWGLKRGCAVAYTDKGTGAAAHDLATDTVALIDGTLATGDAAGANAFFRAPLSAGEREAFNAATPNRLAFKHAHSQQNPEKDWGLNTLRAIEFAFYVLNEKYGEPQSNGTRSVRFTPANTITIASSLSNGGGAALAAAELDAQGLIDGVAVSEPQINLPALPQQHIRHGSADYVANGKPLMEYTAYAALLQPCAALAPALQNAPYAAAYRTRLAADALPIAPNRCQALKNAGLLDGEGVQALAEDALARLQAYGWDAQSAQQYPSLAAFEVSSAVSATYINAYTRAGVQDRLCGYGYASTSATDSAPAPTAQATLATMAALGNGVPPSVGVQLVNENSLGGARRDMLSVNAQGMADWNSAGALCMYALAAGSQGSLSDALAAASPGQGWVARMRTGIDEVRRNGNLRGKPAIIVHGQNDGLLPPNFTSRPYVALNRQVEGDASQLRYIEVTNAQHFDAFIGMPAVLPGYDTRYIPLHVYFNQALDRMYDHLKNGTALPPHQLVRTTARGGEDGQAPALQASHMPAIADTPAEGDRISVSAGRIEIPQ